MCKATFNLQQKRQVRNALPMLREIFAEGKGATTVPRNGLASLFEMKDNELQRLIMIGAMPKPCGKREGQKIFPLETTIKMLEVWANGKER